jgi:hypothetical protein
MQKERNYTIEFFRFMFSINFVLLHVYAVIPLAMGGTPLFANGADVIIPFMAFSGYFLMQNFKKNQALGLTKDISPSRQAWSYLKARLVSLLPLFMLTTAMGIIANTLLRGIPFSSLPMYFINCISEFLGLQLTGFGMGNAFVGMGGVANGPLWFISGIFVVGYAIYYLLAKHDKHFTGWIAPVTIALFFGSAYLNDDIPIWLKSLAIGDFSLDSGLLHMFCGMSIGVLLWVACDNLKGKQWSGGMKIFLTIAQILCIAIVMVKSWISTDSPLGVLLNIGWGATFVYTTIFSFLCLLNVDFATRFPVFSSKIWKVPGRLALYIYMLHYPVIIYVMLAMGKRPGTFDQEAGKIHAVYAITLVICLVFGYAIMKFEEKVLMPWLKSKPWYTREQAAKELEAAKR